MDLPLFVGILLIYAKKYVDFREYYVNCSVEMENSK